MDGKDIFGGRDPDVVSDKGFRFWIVEELCLEANAHGLLDVMVFLAEFPDGKKSYVINQKGKWMCETPYYEAISVHLAVMAKLEKDENDIVWRRNG